MMADETTRLLRHLLATIAYRASRSFNGAPAGFEATRAVPQSMAAGELVHHMTQVLGFAAAALTGAERIQHERLDWTGEVSRFYDQLRVLDGCLVSGIPTPSDNLELILLQGPFADVLTHIGQLNALRRLAGAPVPPERYTQADVRAGRVSLEDQPITLGT